MVHHKQWPRLRNEKTWPSLHTQVEKFVKHCNTSQHYMTQRKKYGHIPVPDKQQIANPWHPIAVNSIGPWIIPQLPQTSKSKEPMILQALTIIDLNTHFMEIVALKNKESITVAHSLNQVWLCRYPDRLIVYMTMGQNSSLPNFKNFFNHMEFNPNWPLSKTAQQELLMPVAYVGHQHNIPYDLKSKPSSTCIQPQHDSSNFLHCQLVGAAGKFEWFE